jgi:PAS domain-containing protein
MKPASSDDVPTRELPAHLAVMVDSVNDAIIGRSLEGRITNWNPAAERSFGHAAGRCETLLARRVGRRMDIAVTPSPTRKGAPGASFHSSLPRDGES